MRAWLLTLSLLIPSVGLAQNGFKYVVDSLAPGGTGTQNVNGQFLATQGNFTPVIGASMELDACVIEGNSSDYSVVRGAQGIYLCNMAARYNPSSNCTVGANNTYVCTGTAGGAVADRISNLTQCSTLSDTAVTGIAECEP